MKTHLTKEMLLAFVEGELGEHQAVAFAEHLDGCPLCATRAAAMEPLGPIFARVPDPIVPADLVEAVLIAANTHSMHQPAPRRPEVLVGGSLLASAAVLSLVFGDPLGWFTHAAVLADVGSSAARAIQIVLPTSILVITLTFASLVVAAGMAATPFRPALERL